MANKVKKRNYLVAGSDGMTVEEIARVEQLHPDTVRYHIGNALRKLRKDKNAVAALSAAVELQAELSEKHHPLDGSNAIDWED